MSRLYDEALLDAKKIREVAEQSAKDRIMETITPQIRKMINNRILFEQEEFDAEEDEEDFSLEPAEDSLDMQPVEDTADLNLDSIVDNMPDVDFGEEVMDAASDAAVSVFAAGDVNIEVEPSEEEGDEDGELMTDLTMAEAFAKLIKRDFVQDKNLEHRITRLEERVKKLRDVMGVVRESRISSDQQHRLELSFTSLVREAVSLQIDLRQSGRGSQRLVKRLNSTIKEMREMSVKHKKNIFDFLFEAEDAEMKKEGMYEQDEMEAEEVEVDDVEVEEAGGEDVDVDAATTALEDLGDALGLDVEVVDDELEDDDDLELGDDAEAEEEDVELEEIYEIDESVLRRELSRLRKARRLREQEEGVDDAVLDNFGDGEPVGDVIEVDEDTLLNVLADELGTVTESRRPRSRRPARRNTAVRKALREAAEYKKAASQLKRQLVEMNLFNAKLLYANKLLQNKNLTVKQQRAIVEALDNAKTLREAKLLYKSLSESLARRGRSGKTLSESVRRTLGSSSRSTRSAQPSKNGVETDRWAVLAGIGK